MTPKFDEVMNRLLSLIEKADKLLLTTRQDPEYAKSKEKHEIVDTFEFVRFRTASLHFIETTVGKDTQYHNAFWHQCQARAPHHVRIGKPLLEELLSEFESRWL